MDLVKELNEIQNEGKSDFGKITRQRLRREKRIMQKERRSQAKQAFMQNKILGGAAAVYKLPEL